MSFGARQYDPQIGFFLSVDPLAAFGGQDSYSPYAAMGNQPESMIDPNGLSPYDFPIISGVRMEAASNAGGEMGGGPGSRAWYDGGMGGYDDRGMSYGLMAFGNITNLIGVNAQRSFAQMTGQTDKLTGDAKIHTGGNGVGGIAAAYNRNNSKNGTGYFIDTHGRFRKWSAGTVSTAGGCACTVEQALAKEDAVNAQNGASQWGSPGKVLASGFLTAGAIVAEGGGPEDIPADLIATG